MDSFLKHLLTYCEQMKVNEGEFTVACYSLSVFCTVEKALKGRFSVFASLRLT